MGIIAFLVVIGSIIFVHELGHFLVAKICGIGVIEFALGFGPKLISKKFGETEYSIRIIPMGGFVRMIGEGDNSGYDTAPYLDKSFELKSPWVRIAVAAAGPIANIILAIVMLATLYATGVPLPTTKIGQVAAGFPAESAGLRAGDVIKEIDGKSVTYWTDAQQLLNRPGDKIIKRMRNGQETTVRVATKKISGKNLIGDKIEVHAIGVTSSGETAIYKQGILPAIGCATQEAYALSALNFMAIGRMFQGKLSPKKCMGGPIAIAQISGEAAKGGTIIFLRFIAIISLILGLTNLLPIPVLDGGLIAMCLIEVIYQKPLSPAFCKIAQTIGLIILIALMVYVFYIDIARIVTNQPLFPK